MYRVIYADPPWSYNDSGATKDGSLGKAARHYPSMTIEQLCRLPVQAHAMPDSILFMWVTVPLLLQNPGPREVLEAWGFTYKSNFNWDKVLGMRGHYSHVTHEHLIVATRGSCLPDAPTPQPKSSQTIRRSDEHSKKPDEFRRLIEKHWTRGPYLELFGRAKVKGWEVFGNDARLWSQDLEPKHVPAEEEVPF
jgi:N6-adenosine-specific RNA methylase IME4